jgi:hypothetical protein
VREGNNLLHAMGDIDYRDSVCGQPADNVKQALGFVDRERRGRFVHDHDPGLGNQRFCDLDQLLFADAQLRDWHSKLSVKIKRIQNLASRPNLVFSVHNEKRLKFLLTQKNIFVDLELRDEAELLLDHSYPGPDGITRRSQANAVSIHEDLAFELFYQPGSDFHQRRLSGAVLAHQRMDFARVDFEIDIG